MIEAPDFTPPRRLVRGLRATAVLGGLVFLVGLFVAPQRAWSGYLMGFVYLVGLGLAGGLFLSVLTLAGARCRLADSPRPSPSVHRCVCAHCYLVSPTNC